MLLKMASSFSCLSDMPRLLYTLISDGRGGCLHVLVIVNSASEDAGVQVTCRAVRLPSLERGCQ